MSENSWYLRTQDETFGPESKEKLVEWARMGRILPGQEVSDDNEIWHRVEEIPFLDMRFSIDIGDGNPRGPFNRAAAEALLASGRLPAAARMVETREPFPEEKSKSEVEEESKSKVEVEEKVEEVAPVTTPLATPTLRQEGLPGLEVEEESKSEVEEESKPKVEVEEKPEVEVEEKVKDQDEGEQRNSADCANVDANSSSRRVEVQGSAQEEAQAAAEARVRELADLLEQERRHAADLQSRLDSAAKDVELLREEFQQKAEAAAQEAASQLESARQKSEIAAQDADARLLAQQKESSAKLAEAEQKLEAAQKEAATQIAALREKLEAAQKDAAAQLEAARQKAAEAAEAADAKFAEAQKAAAEHLAETQKSAADRLAEVQQKAAADVKEATDRLAEVQQKSDAALKDADAREIKSREQIVALENELRRLPQAASEIADLQAAVYSIMTKEATELAELIELEKKESDEFRRRQQERADRLLERRRDLLKRSGANIEDMTRKALVERPEDPRTAQLRREYEEFRRADEKKSREYEDKILAKNREIEELRREISRRNVSDKDATQLQGEVVALREKLQRCEKDLLSERQLNEDLRQRQATNQQVLMARLATLESPTIAPANAAHLPETRQSREAKSVKLPRWMQLGGKR